MSAGHLALRTGGRRTGEAPGNHRKARLTPCSDWITVDVRNGPVAAPVRFTVVR